MGSVVEIRHAVVRHNLSIARDRNSTTSQFKSALSRLSDVLACETTRSLAGKEFEVETPLERTAGFEIMQSVGLVPILRAGLALVESHVSLLPFSKVFHLGMYRDEETALPVSYYNKLAESTPVETALILDPMLATGGSATAAIDALRTWGVTTIKLGCLIAAPEGIAAVQQFDSDVDITVCMIDQHLDANQFIRPGLGDAGDRYFGTT